MTLIEGMTYAHEHTTIDLSALKGSDDTNLNCFNETVEEFKELYNKGVRNIIDVTVMGMERNPEYVHKVTKESKLNIIQSTGWYQDKFLPDYINDRTVDQLAEIMYKDITEGIEGTNNKAELIGEIATSKNEMTVREQKIFEAAVLVQREIELPISTHTTLGTFGKEQIEFFQKQKAPLEKIVIGHVDLTGDSQYILDLLNKGVYVEFDTIGKNNYMPDQRRIEMLKEIEKAGYEDKVFLSMDITRKSHLKYKGGIGYSYLLDEFVPLATQNGVSEKFIEKMLIDNPKEFFD